MRFRLTWGLCWRAGLVAVGALAFACRSAPEGYDIPGPVHVVQVYIDAPAGLHGGQPGDQTPDGVLAWDCQCLATSYQPDGALMPAVPPVADALYNPAIRIILSKIVDPGIEQLTMTEAGNFGYLNLAAHPVVQLSAGMTPIPLAGYYDPSGTPIEPPLGPALEIAPMMPLASGTTYTLTVSGAGIAQLVGKDGVAFAQPPGPAPDQQGGSTFTMTFTVQPFGVVINGQQPADVGAVSANAPVGSMLQITFTAPPDVTKFTTTTAAVTYSSGASKVAGAWTFMGPRTAVFTPSANLRPATKYTVTLKSGASGIMDIAGGLLPMDYTGTFTTQAPAVDAALPAIDLGLPALDLGLPKLDMGTKG